MSRQAMNAPGGVLIAALLMLQGCATIVEGNDQTVSIITDPAGALCQLTRGGQAIGFVNPTPGSVVLEKSADNVSVRCEKDGYLDGGGVLASGFQDMTFGNILLGGVIGVAVDAASGAMHEYPPSVTVVLAPEAFASAGQRDAFYERQASRVESEAATAVVEARKACTANGQSQRDCDRVVGAIEAQRAARLAELESQRRNAAIE